MTEHIKMPDVVPVIRYVANGAQTAFPYPFPIFASEDMAVYKNVLAITWAAQMLGVSYIMVFDTARAGEVLAALGSLSAIWTVGLSVLGIYVYKRSEEKKPPETIFWSGPRKGLVP